MGDLRHALSGGNELEAFALAWGEAGAAVTRAGCRRMADAVGPGIPAADHVRPGARGTVRQRAQPHGDHVAGERQLLAVLGELTLELGPRALGARYG